MTSLSKYITILLIFSQFIMVSASVASGDKHQLGQFSYKGDVFINGSNNTSQGNKYLLNQQLANVKITSDFNLDEWNKIHTLLIYNASPNPINPQFYFDEAFLDLKTVGKLSNGFIHLGKKWLPFGSYKNDLIYKPLTKALGQTNEYTLEAGYDHYLYTKASLFPPHSRISGSSLPVYYNLNVGIHDSNDQFDVGLSYIHSIAESQLFQYNKGFGGFLREPINSRVPGAAIYGHFKSNNFNTYLTYVSATDAFRPNELSFQNHGARPSAFSIQSGYQFNIKNIPMQVIGFYDRSFQALALQLPKQRIGSGLNIRTNKYVDVQFEFYKDYTYGSNITASGLNEKISSNGDINNTFAMQLVLHF